MSLQDLGTISEIITALAVVISLGYIPIQIRQNSRQLNENTTDVPWWMAGDPRICQSVWISGLEAIPLLDRKT